MRLLVVCPSWGRACGIASYTRRLGEGFDSLGVAWDVATSPATITQRLSQGSYDGVILQHEYGLYYFNLIATLNALEGCGLPFLITMHNSDHRAWMGAQHLFLFGTRAKIVVHSQSAFDDLHRGSFTPKPGRLSIIPMGSPDLSASFGPREQVRREMGLDPEAFVVGFFGFAAAHKGVANLIRALSSLPDLCGYISATRHPTNPGAVDEIYTVTGLSRSSRRVDRYGNITMTHEVIPDGPYGRYQNAVDIIALPYRLHGESVSTSMLAHEVLAAYRPIIATDVVYFSDLRGVVHMIPNDQPETIGRAIVTLRDDAALREALCQKAKDYATQHSWPRVAESYLEALMSGV